MTENKRAITGLSPRRADMSAFKPTLATPSAQTPGEPTRKPAPARARKRATPKAPTGQPAPQADAPKVQINFYIDAETRASARAAYKATGHAEGDDSFSDFVSKAVAAEVQRRQDAYNGGEKFTPDDRKLTPGRPLR